MRAWLLCLMLMTAPVVARADQAAISSVISDQMRAFLADDLDRAFSHASPNIKGIFGTPERFGNMVARGYPMVWRPADWRYGPLREVAGNLWQRVEVIDSSGATHALDYQMIETPEGWQINAVHLLPATPPSV